MTTKTRPAPTSARDSASLEMVRELLLDADRKQTADRIDDLESRLNADLKRSGAALRKEIKALSSAMDKRFAAVDRAMDGSDAAREDDVEHQTARLEQAKKSLRAAIDRVDAESKQRAKSLRDRISSVAAKLREEDANQEARITARVESVGAASTSRVELSTLLTEVADHLAENV